MENRVVAHFLDGRVIKGSSFDVFPDRPVCHIATKDQGTVVVRLAEVKALFFVKDLQGNREYQEQHALDPVDPRGRGAKRLEIVFRDGERLVALAPTYQEARSFFFVMPADPKSNNERILVNRAAVESVKLVPPTS